MISSTLTSVSLFQFAPPRGGRRPVRLHEIRGRHFNSRPREGGDRRRHLYRHHRQISIRAPARGATISASASFRVALFQFAPPRGGRRGLYRTPNVSGHFNSRPREGGDTGRGDERGLDLFQFAPPRGGRQAPRDRGHEQVHFNSRPREGGDHIEEVTDSGRGISIRAPARGATTPVFWIYHKRKFQFAPPRGGRPSCPCGT